MNKNLRCYTEMHALEFFFIVKEFIPNSTDTKVHVYEIKKFVIFMDAKFIHLYLISHV